MTHSKSRDARKAGTRDQVVRKAMSACARSGFGAARTADIARAAGLSHGAIFVHFPTRGDLWREVASRMGREITGRLYELTHQGATLRDTLLAHTACLARYEALYRAFLLEGPYQTPDFRRVWTGIQSAVSTHLSKAIDAEATCLRPMPLHLFFNTWIGLVHHYIVNRDLFAPGASAMKRHGPQLVDHFLSLVAREGNHR